VTVVFSSDRKPQGKETKADVAAWHALTLQRMAELLRGTTRGRGPIVVPRSTHLTVVLDTPGVTTIASETMRLVRMRRDAAKTAD